MRLRFSLTHSPSLPPFGSQWETESGDVEWDIDSTPSITLPGPASSDILADFVLQPGVYTISYNFTVTESGISFVNITFPGASLPGQGSTGNFSGAGNFSGTIEIELSSASTQIEISFANASANTKFFVINSLSIEGTSHEISEPDGWKGAKIILERDPQFCDLVEIYEGAAGGAFIFYGENGVEDGGINFIKEIEEIYGFDSNIEFLAELAPDNVNYETIFEGLLELSGKNEMKDNKMQVPVIRDDFWAKFINRMDTPVNLSDLFDLDGNPVDPCVPVTVNLTSQKIQKNFYAYLTYGVEYSAGDDFDSDDYLQFGFDKIETDEISDSDFGYKWLPNVDSFNAIPAQTFIAEFEGQYTFDVKIELSRTDVGYLAMTSLGDDYVKVYIQVNDGTPIEFTKTHNNVGMGDASTTYSFNDTLYLLATDGVRIYGDYQPISDTMTFSDKVVIYGSGANVYPSENPTADETPPSGEAIPTYIRITAQTVYPETQAQGYLIHDLIHGVLARIGLGTDPVRSDFLGSTFTNTRQYDEDGCGWMYAIIKGLQIRQYTLQEKPFFISFKQIWDGINPILNLGLGYEVSEDSPDYQYIRIEQKDYFYDDTTSINFSDVREISSTYDQDFIFKTIKTGYKKWQSENISGIDDVQTKQTRATRFEKVGKDLTLESDFIAASLAIETTRRKTREKSADYKFDNDNFIIALNQDDVSPDVYQPELNENFDSITNLNNPETRYNTILSCLRNFLRWANYVGGCLQSYSTSSYKFVSGEGNYDMTSDYSCASGDICQAILCDSLTESDDISLAIYNGTFGYLHLPLLYDITIPMEWEEYQTIRNNRQKAIGISQTSTGHIPFKIKRLEYDIVMGQANIKAWPKTFLSITVPEQDFTMTCEPPVSDSVYTDELQALLDYAESLGYGIPSDEVLQALDDLITSLKEAQIWNDLDVLYIFMTDGDSDFATLNLIDPTRFQCQKINAPTFTIGQGFLGNGSNAYLNTQWTPSVDALNYTTNENSAFTYINNDYAGEINNFVFGTKASSAGRILLQPRNTNNDIIWCDHTIGIVHATTNTSQGFYQVQRTASNAQRVLKNGVEQDADSTVANGISPNPMFLLCLNEIGSPANFSVCEMGIFGAGKSFNGKEFDLYTLFDDYITIVELVTSGGILLEDESGLIILENGDTLIKET